jgi:hypothetical protein
LKKETCEFWNLDPSIYSLVPPQMNEIMFTNKEPDHEAHRVESYFEIHKSKKAILHLILTDRRREHI